MKQNILILSLAIILASCTGFIKNDTQEGKDWLVDLEEAVELSEKTGKPIMANFTGSDWCIWCKRLKAEVFDTPEFQEWAAENVILLELDFPRRTAIPDDLRKQNMKLQVEFGVRGFPTVHIFNASQDGPNAYSFEKLAQTGYVRGGSAAWLKDANSKLNL
jgi:thiol-disulfide isomerase/thioredoxin